MKFFGIFSQIIFKDHLSTCQKKSTHGYEISKIILHYKPFCIRSLMLIYIAFVYFLFAILLKINL
jgi:hypothetical protein